MSKKIKKASQLTLNSFADSNYSSTNTKIFGRSVQNLNCMFGPAM
jgi:hypothetical protein